MHLSPSSAKAFFRQSTALLHLARAADAVVCLQLAVQLHPDCKALSIALDAAHSAARADQLRLRSASLAVSAWSTCSTPPSKNHCCKALHHINIFCVFMCLQMNTMCIRQPAGQSMSDKLRAIWPLHHGIHLVSARSAAGRRGPCDYHLYNAENAFAG